MSRQFLLDGYNVMKQMPALADRSLEGGRTGLIRFIRERRPHGSDRNAVTVVFDGQEGVCSPDLSTDVRVIFTRGTSADDHIRQEVEDASDPRRIVVVTDDRELGLMCRHRGAELWSVEEFVARGYKEETVARRRRDTRDRREGEQKVITEVAARRIDRELSGVWLQKKA